MAFAPVATDKDTSFPSSIRVNNIVYEFVQATGVTGRRKGEYKTAHRKAKQPKISLSLAEAKQKQAQ